MPDRPVPPLARVLIRELDAPAQAARFARRGARAAIREITGMVRIGMLVAEKVVVTDAMVLDGAWFLALGPGGVRAELGVGAGTSPFVVSSRAESLGAGLAARLADPAFRWSSGGGGDATVAAGRRERWVRDAAAGVVTFERQRGEPVWSPPPTPGVSPDVPDRLVARLRHIPRRSAALQLIESARLGAADHATLAGWWEDAYSQMLARATGAAWVRFDGDDPALVGSARALPLPATLVAWAPEVTPATFARAWDRTAGPRERLRRRPTWGRMRDLALAAVEVPRPSTRLRGWLQGIGSLLLGAAAVAAALPWWQGDGATDPLTWAVFALAALATFPYAALATVVDLLRPDARAVILVHGGSRD